MCIEQFGHCESMQQCVSRPYGFRATDGGEYTSTTLPGCLGKRTEPGGGNLFAVDEVEVFLMREKPSLSLQCGF